MTGWWSSTTESDLQVWSGDARFGSANLPAHQVWLHDGCFNYPLDPFSNNKPKTDTQSSYSLCRRRHYTVKEAERVLPRQPRRRVCAARPRGRLRRLGSRVVRRPQVHPCHRPPSSPPPSSSSTPPLSASPMPPVRSSPLRSGRHHRTPTFHKIYCGRSSLSPTKSSSWRRCFSEIPKSSSRQIRLAPLGT
jgi:hypothetical protein